VKRTQQFITAVIVVLTVLLIGTNLAFSRSDNTVFAFADDSATPQGDSLLSKIFLPLMQQLDAPFTISGRVLDEYGQPVSGVEVVDQRGQKAITGQDGNYRFDGLSAGDYDLAPAKGDLKFSPAMSSVDLPGGGSEVDFTAVTACDEALSNLGFENDSFWVFPATPHTAGYSTSLAHSGSRSARTGIIKTADNTFSYSSVRTPVIKIPSDMDSATLRVWLYPISEEGTATTMLDAPQGPDFGEAVFSHDAQYALVLDPGANPEAVSDDTLLETLLWIRSDSQTWMLHEFDLSEYAGESIKLQFGTFNDGANGVSALFVDDVSFEICDDLSVTPAPTPTGVPAACQNRLDNSGFELNGSWDIPLTVWPAAYTTEQAHSGSRSMRTGIVRTTDNVFSYSDAGQWVTIPSNAAAATLRMWTLPVTEGSSLLSSAALPPRPEIGITLADFQEEALADDVQYVLILDGFSQVEEVLLWQRRDAADWELREFDLTKYKGRTIKVQFGTFNNGSNGVTSMYVDDATVVSCPTTAPTPTATATPIPTSTPAVTPTPTNTPIPGTTPTPTSTPESCSNIIKNGHFEKTSDWVIPITAFSADYDDSRPRVGERSMRTGIIHSAHNRFSYSDFRQTVTIPADADSARVRFWVYSLSQDAALLDVPGGPLSEVFGKNASGGDAQYVLILNAFGNWIDTLVWQRSDAAKWTFMAFDLDHYIGSTIKLQFGTFNDGLGGVSSMYVDDVSLQVCR
jgi:hypothetical protein